MTRRLKDFYPEKGNRFQVVEKLDEDGKPDWKNGRMQPGRIGVVKGWWSSKAGTLYCYLKFDNETIWKTWRASREITDYVGD